MSRYTSATDDDRRAMLAAIGADSIDALFADLPEGVRLDRPLDLPDGKPEQEVYGYLRDLAAQNVSAEDEVSFLGAGFYDHYVPALIDSLLARSEFLTPYTPYQPEVSQGTLQLMFEYQTAMSELTGLPEDSVQVHNHLLGGGFGRRLDVDFVADAVKIAKQVDYPVKVIWSREEDTRHSTLRPYHYNHLSAGLDEQGRPVAWTHKVTGASILARWAPSRFTNNVDGDAVRDACGPYAFPNLAVHYVRHEPPAGMTIAEGTHFNPFFIAGKSLAMAKPLSDDQVTYDDGSPQTVDQYARDVAAFLMWAAEPHLEARKQTGFRVMVFLVLFAGLVYLTKRKVWANVAH